MVNQSIEGTVAAITIFRFGPFSSVSSSDLFFVTMSDDGDFIDDADDQEDEYDLVSDYGCKKVCH